MLKPNGMIYAAYASKPIAFFEERRDKVVSMLENAEINYTRCEVLLLCRMWSAFALSTGFAEVAWQAVEEIKASSRKHIMRERWDAWIDRIYADYLSCPIV